MAAYGVDPSQNYNTPRFQLHFVTNSTWWDFRPGESSLRGNLILDVRQFKEDLDVRDIVVQLVHVVNNGSEKTLQEVSLYKQIHELTNCVKTHSRHYHHLLAPSKHQFDFTFSPAATAFLHTDSTRLFVRAEVKCDAAWTRKECRMDLGSFVDLTQLSPKDWEEQRMDKVETVADGFNCCGYYLHTGVDGDLIKFGYILDKKGFYPGELANVRIEIENQSGTVDIERIKIWLVKCSQSGKTGENDVKFGAHCSAVARNSCEKFEKSVHIPTDSEPTLSKKHYFRFDTKLSNEEEISHKFPIIVGFLRNT